MIIYVKLLGWFLNTTTVMSPILFAFILGIDACLLLPPTMSKLLIVSYLRVLSTLQILVTSILPLLLVLPNLSLLNRRRLRRTIIDIITNALLNVQVFVGLLSQWYQIRLCCIRTCSSSVFRSGICVFGIFFNIPVIVSYSLRCVRNAFFGR